MRAVPLGRLADLRIRQGRFEEAERLLEGAEWHPAAKRLLAAIAFGRGDLSLAEDLARLVPRERDPPTPRRAPLLDLLVDIRLARGDPAGAQEAADRLTDSRRSRALPGPSSPRAGAAPRRERAATHLQAAVEKFSALDLPLEAGRARLALARALAPGTPAAAVAEARLALGTFEHLGAVRDADRAAELLRGLGAGGRAWPRGRGALTKRQTEVLALVAEGCTDAEIAERLYISRRTAEHHVAASSPSSACAAAPRPSPMRRATQDP